MFKKVLAATVLLYMLAGFFLLPYLLKKGAIEFVKDKYNLELNLERVSFNPFSFELELKGVKLKDEQDTMLSLKHLRANLEPHSLLFGAIHLQNISLIKPYIFTKIKNDGSLNFDVFSKDEPQETSTSDALRVVVDSIRVSGGEVEFLDELKEFKTAIKDIDIRVDSLDTKQKKYKNTLARVALRFDDGGELRAKNTISSFEPLKIDANLNIERFRLFSIYRYIKDMLNIELSSGYLSGDINYHINTLESIDIKDSILSLDDVRFKPKTKDNDFVSLDTLSVKLASLKPLEHSIDIETIELRGFELDAKRLDDGSLDVESYFATNTPKDSPDSEPSEWSANISKIDLGKISLKLEDRALKPSVTTTIDELNLNISDISYPSSDMLNYSLELKANGAFLCDASGEVNYKNIATLSSVDCRGFELSHYNPYIKQVAKENFEKFDVVLDSASVGFKGDIDADISLDEPKIGLQNGGIFLDNLKLSTKKSPLLTLKHFEVDGISLDSDKKTIYAKDGKIDSFVAFIDREKDGAFSFDNIVVVKQATKKDETKKDEPYEFTLDSFGVQNSKLNFSDNSLEDRVELSLSKIKLDAKNISTIKDSRVDYEFSSTLGGDSKIYSKANINTTTLDLDGRFGVKNLPLNKLNPYLKDSTYIKLNSGLFNLESKLTHKKDELKARGNLWLEGVDVEDYRDDKLLISLPKLNVKSFEYEKDALDVKEVLVDGFYVDAQIDKDKNFNLAGLIKQGETQSESQKSDFSYSISKVDFKNANMSFADYSLPIKFKTLVHNLNGAVGAISSRAKEITMLELKGSVDDYGEADIKGELKSADPKSYLDIGIDFKNLDLSAMSGYSAEFAGYTIDDGRLFLALDYSVLDSKLKSSNKLSIKKIELGSTIEDENITKLPLPLAVMLLEDNNRVIDINLPIEGDIDSPDFKYGSVVLRAFINLIGKAITSPFSLLAGAIGLGDGENLDGVLFEAGKSEIMPQQKEVLDKIVQILEQREKLHLGISVGYNIEGDLLALKSIKLKQEVARLVNNRRSTISILENIYKSSYSSKELKALQDSIKEQGGNYDILYQKAIMLECAKLQEIKEDEVLALIKLREDAIGSYIEQKNLEYMQRVEFLAPKEQELDEQEYLKSEFVIEL